MVKEAKHYYDENFKLNGTWEHYIINPERYGEDKMFADYVFKETWYNGQFKLRQKHIKWMFEQIKNNKTLEDWEKFAKLFVKGFTEDGCVQMHSSGEIKE